MVLERNENSSSEYVESFREILKNKGHMQAESPPLFFFIMMFFVGPTRLFGYSTHIFINSYGIYGGLYHLCNRRHTGVSFRGARDG